MTSFEGKITVPDDWKLLADQAPTSEHEDEGDVIVNTENERWYIEVYPSQYGTDPHRAYLYYLGANGEMALMWQDGAQNIGDLEIVVKREAKLARTIQNVLSLATHISD